MGVNERPRCLRCNQALYTIWVYVFGRGYLLWLECDCGRKRGL